MLTKKICVFDFETDGSDPFTCSPVQLAAVIVDPIKLEIIPDSEFEIKFKPEVLEKDKDFEYKTDILDFHAKVKGCKASDILSDWHNYPKQEQSWNQFTSYLEKYHCRSSKKSCFSAPISCGYNIQRFDLPIVQRLSEKYKNLNKEKKTNIFYPRDVLDLMNLMFYWFENNNDIKSYSLDNMREYFGISKEGAHDALKDVEDCAKILIRFLRLHRNLAEKIKFKEAFA
jgi:DNA polymerase III epsilon subunit-like protein